MKEVNNSGGLIKHILTNAYNADEMIMLTKRPVEKDERYRLAMQSADLIVFDYSVENRRFWIAPDTQRNWIYDKIFYGTLEHAISSGHIHMGSIEKFEHAFKAIDSGVPLVQTEVTLLNEDDLENIFELTLTAFYTNNIVNGAVGFLHDVTMLKILENEQRYRQAMTSVSLYNYEINFTQDLYITNTNIQEKFGLKTDSYSKICEYVIENIVYAPDREKYRNFSNVTQNILLYQAGKNHKELEYRSWIDSGDGVREIKWVRNTLHFIRDLNTKDIKAFVSVYDINDKKLKEMQEEEEKKFYDLMRAKSSHIYEINITKNIFIKGHKQWKKIFDMDDTYSLIIEKIGRDAIHYDDKKMFRDIFMLSAIEKMFNEGKKEISCEYRLMENGAYSWVSSIMHVFADAQEGDVKAYIYVQNIHSEKVKKLELIYKTEHDELTDVYNKITTEIKVDNYLKEKPNEKHALCIFDIDHFKAINDNFGHAFGDAVLSQISRKVKDIFSQDDIIGRIGGDEFVALYTNIASESLIYEKASAICRVVSETYSVGEKDVDISASVGIAVYKKDGLCYKELYHYSDIALYFSKQNGRNQFTFYNASLKSSFKKINDIRSHELILNQSFESGITDYVFRILYENIDKALAINLVLEMIGKHFGASRAYIFEENKNGLRAKMTFEWCGRNMIPILSKIENIIYEKIGFSKEAFDESDICYIKDARTVNEKYKSFLTSNDIQSLIHFAVLSDAKYIGYVGFDWCEAKMALTREQITQMKNVANIVGVFLREMRTIQECQQSKKLAMSIVNSLDSYAYIIDKNTYKLLFINEKTRDTIPRSKVGALCYNVFLNIDKPCEECPMHPSSLEDAQRTHMSKYNSVIGKWIKITCSRIEWANNDNAFLVNSTDVSEYISGKIVD